MAFTFLEDRGNAGSYAFLLVKTRSKFEFKPLINLLESKTHRILFCSCTRAKKALFWWNLVGFKWSWKHQGSIIHLFQPLFSNKLKWHLKNLPFLGCAALLLAQPHHHVIFVFFAVFFVFALFNFLQQMQALNDCCCIIGCCCCCHYCCSCCCCCRCCCWPGWS